MPATGDVGRNDSGHDVVMYGLSTCVWCKKMREFLESENVAFRLIYVDKIEGDERQEVMREVRKWNPASSFPVVVVDDQRSVNGYRPDEVREVLGL
jgi:glutaredoxin-like protein NrdH